MLRIVAIVTLLAVSASVMLFIAGCDGSSGPGVGSIEGYVFGQIAVGSTANSRAMAVGRGPTPPPGYEAIQGAVVMVTGSSTIATTDAAGYFRIDNVVAGPQTVTVSKADYLTAVVAVTVAQGQLVTVADALLEPSSRKWTFLVFLNADNSLEPWGIEDVNAMEMVGSSAEVDIIVQMDRIIGYDTSNGDWTGCRRMRIERDSDPATITSPVLQEMGELDMGDWQVLRDFVQWGTTNYPAEHYVLVLWNHGNGWRSATAESRNPLTRGVSFDDTSGTNISIPDLPRALDVQPRLDIISFDACLMQMTEVAYELRHFGRIMVGSEDNWPNEGYPYQTFLATLVATPTMTPEQFAGEIVTQSVSYYTTGGYTIGLTQSAVSLAKMDSLASALDGFARALATAMPTFSTQIASARSQAQRYWYPDNKDLYDFARLVSAAVPRDNVTTAAQAVTQAVDDTVFAEAHNAARANSHGLAIYVPSSTTYASNRSSYQQLELSANTFWDNWLAISPP